jgi:hypothetical protein
MFFNRASSIDPAGSLPTFQAAGFTPAVLTGDLANVVYTASCECTELDSVDTYPALPRCASPKINSGVSHVSRDERF